MLTTLDWIIISGLMTAMFFIAISFKNKASKNLESFFLGGRNLPWYIAGISMVATTFAADTPLAVTEIIGQNGISGNWIWWNFLIGGMLTVFFFSRLWRRANILTEVEFIELRYGGKPAAWLRGFKGIYLGLFMNILVIGWVNLAMATILEVFFNLSHESALLYCGLGMLIAGIYTSVSGLIGVAITDVIQFVLAMTGSLLLAFFVIDSPEIGGLNGLVEKVPQNALEYFPAVGEEGMGSFSLSLTAFIAFFGFIWWASWYPGAEPGGGGYISQRMMSTPDEKSALKSTLLFQIAHYCIRPWPWILVGLACIPLFEVSSKLEDHPDLKQAYEAVQAQYPSQNIWKDELESSSQDWKTTKEKILAISEENTVLKQAVDYQEDNRFGYVMAMKKFLPPGIMGLMLVAFFSAYLSTISTQLNWGASYLVNDFYGRFISKTSDNKKLVTMSRLATVLIMVLGLIVSFFIESITGVWTFLMECGAGLGMVLILRWFWYRINVWSEITATLAPFVGYTISHYLLDWVFPNSFFFTVGFTTVAWIIITFLTKPESPEILQKFIHQVKPGGIWGKYQTGKSGFSPWNFIGWLSAVVFTYSLLFVLGDLLLQKETQIYQWILLVLGLGMMLKSLRKIQTSASK